MRYPCKALRPCLVQVYKLVSWLMQESTKSSLTFRNSGWIPLPSIQPLLKILIFTVIVTLFLALLFWSTLWAKKTTEFPVSLAAMVLPGGTGVVGEQVHVWKPAMRWEERKDGKVREREPAMRWEALKINAKERPWRSLGTCAPWSSRQLSRWVVAP